MRTNENAGAASWVATSAKPQKSGPPTLEVGETNPLKDVMGVVTGWGEWPALHRLEGVVTTPAAVAGARH